VLFDPSIVGIGSKLQRGIPPQVGHVFQVIASGGKALIEKAVLGHIKMFFNENSDSAFRFSVCI
jgi:hypothetical protein